MVEPLKSAGDQLRAAWDNYYHVYLALQSSYRKTTPHVCKNRPEFASQLETELAFISSYEPKIQDIKVIINRARNYSTGLAPINSLPPEILAHIFHMVLPQPCNLHLLPDNNNENFPRYPDYLTQVCSLWRKTAIAFRSLWSHIDLSSYEPSYTRDSILDGTGPNHKDLYKLVSRISSRTGTLVFVVTANWKSFHRTLFNQVLFDRSPAVTKLVMRSDHNHFNTFICPSKFNPGNLDQNSARFRLDISGRYVERGFAPLKVLHLRGIFPVWSSTAYHGLVDLRLLSTAEWSYIREAQLITILKSSPKLRILHFGLDIRSSAAGVTEEAEVNLQDLQVIRIFTTSPSYPGKHLHPSTLLRLLAPGSKPLRLCFNGHYKPEDGSVIEL
ncbi:hypothetical protein B0J17DRAFT_632245 [Rhizoctonia solani]|nr:hypothetical protein B0J17DRAFT_632245 [Rhizoctonia solani]